MASAATQTAPGLPSVTRRESQGTKEREECIAHLGKGHSFAELSERCKEILGANSKVGILARRNSAVGRIWAPSDGHNSRSYSESTFVLRRILFSSTNTASLWEKFSSKAKHQNKLKKLKNQLRA